MTTRQLTIQEYLDRPRFDGPCYDEAADQQRLTGQILRVFDAIKDGRWRTLGEIAAEIGDPEASVSAQLRHLRKKRFGAWVIDKRRRGAATTGLWEYRMNNTGDAT